jgi:hypothetical protein
MARYDYGLRGPWDRIPRRGNAWDGPPDYEADSAPRRPRPNRVTARYNLDYVRPTEEERYARNPNPYAGDWYGRVGDQHAYRRPYITRGGTWTMRGASPDTRYDRPDYGPDFGGRYPDEL